MGTVGYVSEEADDAIVINFPNLPDEIDLFRTSEWHVTPSPLLPDGFHIYDHTSPLEIPLSFKIHAFDDYAINGPETILQIAAKLHALQLPIINGNQTANFAATREGGDPPPNGSEAGKELSTSVTVSSPSSSGIDYFFPPACVLNLMVGSGGPATFDNPAAYGIICIGYVKDVSAKLKGPWLNSGQANSNRNLPSMGEFSFKFVHAPSYTNVLTSQDSNIATAQIGAYAMKRSFYNTLGALTSSTIHTKDSSKPALSSAKYKGLI